jgi:uncharacterized repeat protein (TIGR03803 family)
MMTVGVRAFLLLLHRQRRCGALWLLAAVAPWLVVFPAASVAGPTLLYTFSAPALSNDSVETNSDGIGPGATMVLGSDGNLYGTALHGGVNGAGSVFRVTPAGAFTNLYSFPPATNSSGDSFNLAPNELTEGSAGNFYGTTQSGGSNFTGSIFVISPSGAFSNLYTFGALEATSSGVATSPDGVKPTGALALGNDGNLYGTTQFGGANGTGTIFRITPGGVFTSLYSFSKSRAGLVSTNAAVPNALVLSTNGAFYGTTRQGGVDNAGTFFTFTAAGGLTQIYSFDGASPGGKPITPNGALVQGSNGVFYGTSAFGGTQGGGTIFEITAAGVPTVLHSFPELSAGAGAALTVGVDGNIYGTTAANGANGNGTVFRLTPGGDYGAYSFAPLDTNLDNAGGADPLAALTADAAGNLYGACSAGGTNNAGVIFQLFAPNFIPPFFVSVTNPPPPMTNVLVGASVILSYDTQGIAPLTCQWLRNGTNLTDGGDILGSLSNTLIIDPVFTPDTGGYALVISNVWGASTSSVTALSVASPGISIFSPAASARTNAPKFAGTAVSAAAVTNINPADLVLAGVIFSISNLFSGSVVTGAAVLSAGANGVTNWAFAATPFPGTNVLSVQAVDASGNISPAASRTFFYEVPVPLTIVTAGSGTGSFSVTNGAMLDVGGGYTITARPNSSRFSSWEANGIVNFDPTLSFEMQSNLVLTADFLALQSPVVSISAPAANARTASSVFEGTAQSSPLLPGVNPTNVVLTNVAYSLSNAATGSVITGSAAVTSGGAVSNWSITATPLPGANTLAVQGQDVSGGVSRVVTRAFFYKMPSIFGLLESGTGSGAVTGTASVPGDVPPANGANLNVGERYTVIARPDAFSTFGGWLTSDGASSSEAALVFIMQLNLTLTAMFDAKPPVVTITSPAENQRTAAPIFQGTAFGHFPIKTVTCSVGNTGGAATLTQGAGTATDWSIALVPSPGPNTLTVSCVDADGNQSAVISRKFFYEVPAQLSVVIAGPGNGTVRGTASVPGDTVPANGAMLNIGESYKITAIPDSSSLFSNWAGAVGGGAPTITDTRSLTFVMQSNLVLTVTFATNFFPAVAGSYNGLFFPPGAVTEETSGMIYNLLLRNTGAFSGQLLTPAENYNFTGNFDASGNAAFRAGPLQVALALDSATPQITGTVSSAHFSANLTAELASSALPSGRYTFLFAASASTNDSGASPPGDGYALAAVQSGLLNLSGALADGTSYHQSAPISRSGDAPVYASLHHKGVSGNPGLLLGWINLTNNQAAAPVNTLTWIKQPSASGAPYTGGFTNALSVQGAIWTNPPPNTAAISMTNGQLIVSNASLLLTFTNIAVNSDNSLTNLGPQPTNALTGFINPETGLVTIKIDAGNGSTITNLGAILQNTTNGGGYFLTPTSAGDMILRP